MRASIRPGNTLSFVRHLDPLTLQRAWGFVIGQEGVLVSLRPSLGPAGGSSRRDSCGEILEMPFRGGELMRAYEGSWV